MTGKKWERIGSGKVWGRVEMEAVGGNLCKRPRQNKEIQSAPFQEHCEYSLTRLL